MEGLDLSTPLGNDEKPPRSRSPRFSLAQLSVLGVSAGGIVLLVAGALIYQLYAGTAERYLQQRVHALAGEVTYRLASLMQDYAAAVQVAASDPQVVAALGGGDGVNIANAELRLRKRFSNALRVQLLRPNAENAELGRFPQLGFADLDMVRGAERTGSGAPVEAHLFGTEEAHIDILRAVRDAEGGPILGHLLVSYGGDLLRQALEQVALGAGFVRVLQRNEGGNPLLLVERGDRGLMSGEPRVVTLAGTRWQLSYWPTAAEQQMISKRVWTMVAVFIAAFGLLALIAYAIHRTLSRSIQSDLETVIDLVRDLRAGKHAQSEYSVRISEFQGTVDMLSAMSHLPAATELDTPYLARTSPLSAAPAAPNPGLFLLERGEQEQSAQDHVVTPLQTVPASIFRAYDIRGVVGDTLTADIVRAIGRALGTEAYTRGQQSIVIARDGRHSGPDFITALSEGLRAAGRDVIDIGCVPTPLLYFATHYLNTGSGVMVTGSHNPSEYNGLKMVLKGDTLAEDDIQQLRSRIEVGDFASGSGGLQNQDLVHDYVGSIVADIHLARPLKVVIDCGNGVAGAVAPQLFRALGCEVVELFCEVDGSFPNHHPDPSQPENLQDLIHIVAKHRADLGLAFDGDGDRVALVDDDGHIIWPDRQMMLYSRDVLSRNPGAQIIFDVKCSRHLATWITKHGGQPLMWKTGHSLIKRKMKETGALLAGEMSGHIFFKERWFGFDDGLYTAARLLEIVAAEPRPVHEIFAELPDGVNTPELRIGLQEGQQGPFMERLLSLAQFKGAVLTTIDGLRADFEDGWGLVRASNTTPSLILRFEANTEAALQRIQGEFRTLLQRVDDKLAVPF